MTRVRFHLGQGEHYRHWQVIRHDGTVEYHDPDKVSLVLLDCRLRNWRGTAQRIHDGENKSPCAWVCCDDAIATIPVTFWPGLDGRQIAYNPRVAPHWRDEAGGDIDGRRYGSVVTSGRRLAVGVDR